MALLETKIQPTSWFPISGYRSLTRFLWEFEGNGAVDYLRRRGEAAADRILAAGLYQQLDFLTQRFAPMNMDVFRHDLKLVVTLQGAFFNFTTWQAASDPDHADRLQIEIRDAEHFPEEICHATAGFVTQIAAQVRASGLQWYPERPRPDLVILRMDRRATFLK